MQRILGSEERKKGERGLQIEEEENEGRNERNESMTEGGATRLNEGRNERNKTNE
jgi:hypothetical protein